MPKPVGRKVVMNATHTDTVGAIAGAVAAVAALVTVMFARLTVGEAAKTRREENAARTFERLVQLAAVIEPPSDRIATGFGDWQIVQRAVRRLLVTLPDIDLPKTRLIIDDVQGVATSAHGLAIEALGEIDAAIVALPDRSGSGNRPWAWILGLR